MYFSVSFCLRWSSRISVRVRFHHDMRGAYTRRAALSICTFRLHCDGGWRGSNQMDMTDKGRERAGEISARICAIEAQDTMLQKKLEYAHWIKEREPLRAERYALENELVVLNRIETVAELIWVLMTVPRSTPVSGGYDGYGKPLVVGESVCVSPTGVLFDFS